MPRFEKDKNHFADYGSISKNILEKEFLLTKNQIPSFAGYRFMCLGSNTDQRLFKLFDHPHKFQLNSPEVSKISDAIVALSDLPLPSESVDCVLLQHVLEFSENPQKIVSEVSRVIVSGGNLLIFIINPISPLGVKKYLLAKYYKERNLIYVPLRMKRIVDWLSLLNFEIKAVVEQHSMDSEETHVRQVKKLMPLNYPIVRKFISNSNKLFYNVYCIHGIKRRNAGIRVPKLDWALSTQKKVKLIKSVYGDIEE